MEERIGLNRFSDPVWTTPIRHQSIQSTSQFLNRSAINQFRCLFNSQQLEVAANLINLDDVGSRQSAHARSVMLHAIDNSIMRKALQRLRHRGPTDTQMIRKFLSSELHARGQLAAHDEFDEPLVNGIR